MDAAASAWPAGTACEFLWQESWFRAVSAGIATAAQDAGEPQPCLNLVEVRSRGVVTHLPIEDVADAVVAKGTHLSWSAADEKKIAQSKNKRPSSTEGEVQLRQEEPPQAAPPAKKPKRAAKSRAAPTKPRRAAAPSLGDEDEDKDKDGDEEPASSNGRGRPRRASAQFSVRAMLKSVAEEDLDSMDGLSSAGEDEGSDYDEGGRRAARAPPKRKRAPSKKAAAPQHDYEADGSDYEGAADADGEAGSGGDDDYNEGESDDEPRRGKGAKAKATAKAKAKAKATASGGPKKGGGGKARAGPPRDDGKWVGPKPKPAAAPTFAAARVIKNAPAQGALPFVDAAGLDIEDRGVEWIVEHQCEKLLPLLRDALSHGELDLSMATACSGTDAPVVAMRVAREALRRHGVGLDFEHVMSCEIEPYKQSFIARNHPGVLLFPDVAQLGATKRGEQATTAYGGVAHVPPAKMIVAGTSCKDFSNLKGKHKKSIEEMGTSGETFVGFVNLLFEQRYPVGILENLKGAEWEKMSHYITGELPLGSVGDAGGHEVRFQAEGGAFVVCEVSESAGAKLGAKLRGYKSAERGAVTPITPAGFEGATVGLASLRERFGLQDEHVLVFEVPVQYKTTLAYLDGKEFGVPQTRQRKYMLIWDPAHFGAGVDVELLWHALVQHLRCPLKYNIDSFLLADENDRVHRFRDALRGPLGRLTAVSRQGGDWWTSQSKDVLHNKKFRNCKDEYCGGANMLESPCEEEARPFTNWRPQGEVQLASERWWPELMAVLSQRQLDLIDCFGIKAAEAGLDVLHHSLWWNISQNAGRTDVIPRPGLTGCITPGGELFGPHVGRCILGYEKLLLSGIPADRLLLGTESEVQLSDLAGNAMVMPVVSAAILAVLALPAYARRLQANPKFGLHELAKEGAKEGAKEAAKTPAGGGAAGGGAAGGGAAGGGAAGGGAAGGAAKGKAAKAAKGKGAAAAAPAAGGAAGGGAAGGALLERLRALLPLCAAAEATSILCTSETSGGISESQIVRCADCGVTLSRSCGAAVDLRSHEQHGQSAVFGGAELAKPAS